MSSKADYLKKYLSSGDTVESKKESKRRRKIKKRANLAIHDDDVDWRSLVPQDQPESEEEDGEDEAPQVAEFKDDSIRKVVQWQPVDSGRALSEDDDLSPPRLPGGRRLDSPDLSPPRREKRCDSDNDLSPPRRRPRADRGAMIRARKRHDSPQLIESGPSAHRREDLGHHSPPRRKRHDSDVNSPPRRKRHDSDVNSPPRRKRHDSDDNSPPRRKRHNLSPPRKADRDQRSPDLSLPRKSDEERMSSGAKAGLQSAQILKEENAMVRKRQEDFFRSLDPSLSGRHAETVYRDKKGKKVDPKLEKLKEREKEREMEEENERFMKWGRGAAQAQSYEEKLQDDLYEMSKPLARYADDEDLEKMLKEKERAGDPMLAFIKKSKPSSDKPSKRAKRERPTYKGSFPPNRYGIRPGYRWDGVNRSNGFEKTWFTKEANSKAVAEEAYKWSVEDM